MRRASSAAIWSMGRTIAARNARIRAAITQWPTAVVKAMTARQMHSMMKVRRLDALRRRSKVASSNSEIRKPAMLTTESERVTMLPAISFAFARPKERKTPKEAGATTAPKKRAAPNQQASKIRREKFISVSSESRQSLDRIYKIFQD